MRILIADDDAISRRILEAKLVKWGYEVVVACDGSEAWQVLKSATAPQLAILDWIMPGMDGVELCRKVRKRSQEAYTYLILLTTMSGNNDLIVGMDSGADDYLTKPFRTDELQVRLRAGRRIIELQNELVAAREYLRIKATHDSLTGLLNHEEILRILKGELTRAARVKGYVSIVMADIDYFKRVNDSHGHLTGDTVLSAIAERILTQLRPYDAVGRYGGEEFLVVAPGCESESAMSLAERLRAVVGGKPVDTPDGMVPVTISLGVAVSGVGMQMEVNSLIQAADSALYRAKENGRNRVEFCQVNGNDLEALRL